MTFDLGGHVTLGLTISTSHNILRCLTHQKIGNWISFKNICISTISRYVFSDIFAFLSFLPSIHTTYNLFPVIEKVTPSSIFPSLSYACIQETPPQSPRKSFNLKKWAIYKPWFLSLWNVFILDFSESNNILTLAFFNMTSFQYINSCYKSNYR